MKKKSTILKLLFFILVSINLMFSQEDYGKKIQGSWKAYKLELKSSKKMLNFSYLKFRFSNKNLHMLGDPTLETSTLPITFSINGNLIKTSKVSESGFVIEKINSDSLVISDSYENDAKRYFFLKEKSYCDFKSIENSSETIFLANENCTPKQNSSIISFLHSKLKGKIKSDFTIVGKLTLYTNEDKVETIIISEDIDNDKKLKKIIQHLNETYKFWNLSKFKNFKAVEIPFILKGKKNVELSSYGYLDNIFIKFL